MSAHMAGSGNAGNMTVLYGEPSAQSPLEGVAMQCLNCSGGSWNASGTGNSANGTAEDELYFVPTGLVVLLSVLYGSISAITVIGNTLVITVVVKNRSMHNVTNFFIANLACADVMIGVFSIPFQFQAALLQRWDLPSIMCPVAPFVKELTVNVSVFTLGVISIDRFFAVIHPLKPRCSGRIARIVMSVVWIFSMGCSIPTLIAFRVIMRHDKPYCYPHFAQVHGVDLGKVYRLFILMVQYFVPLAVICYAYFRIMHRIWGNKAPGSAVSSRDQMMHRNKKKVIKMLLIVVILFAFCWLPLQTYNLLSETTTINKYKYINIIWFTSNWLAMSNSCYNPFIYGLLNEKFKHAFRLLFRRCPCVRKDLMKKESFFEQSEASLRKPCSTAAATANHNNCHDETRMLNGNGTRVKKYVRVSGVEATDQSFL